MRISFKCVLNSHVFGIRSSEIACDFRIANEVEMGHDSSSKRFSSIRVSSFGRYLFTSIIESKHLILRDGIDYQPLCNGFWKSKDVVFNVQKETWQEMQSNFRKFLLAV